MADIIRLLSDTVANQIAAGEVIQRPASAVKELMENAVDAGARRIHLVLKDAGKTLIQIVDDGCGMSETDARLCFERHATSKLRAIDDLFALRTMGFRGEALASVASVAQVELRTRPHGEEVGFRVLVEGGQHRSQDQIATSEGTSISVRNLFYNVPARRNFLKSDPVEFRHVQEEFIRVALAHPEIHFEFHHNDNQVFDLRPGNLRQRIAGVFGKLYNERLVPVEEETSIVRVEGYVGKPEFAKKSRGEQYFYVNGRFIKDPYLHHAVNAAFDSLLPGDAYPSYWLRLQVDPASIDVNIHPTKTEIKFSYDKDIYAILRSAVKRAIGRFSVAPSLDFEQEPSFEVPLAKLDQIPRQPEIRINPNYNPFRTGEEPKRFEVGSVRSTPDRAETRQWLHMHREETTIRQSESLIIPSAETSEQRLLRIFEDLDDFRFVHVGQGIASASHPEGLVLIHLAGARERVLYEDNLRYLSSKPAVSQQQLFPVQVQFNPNDYLVVCELLPELQKLGFDLAEFGGNTLVVQGRPAELDAGDESSVLHELVERFKQQTRDSATLPVHERLARSFARTQVQRQRSPFASREIRQLAIDLLHCEEPFAGLSGEVLLRSFDSTQLQNLIQPNRSTQHA